MEGSDWMLPSSSCDGDLSRDVVFDLSTPFSLSVFEGKMNRCRMRWLDDIYRRIDIGSGLAIE